MGVCTKCGMETEDDAAFCKSCGRSLAGRGASSVNGETVRVTAGEKKRFKAVGIAGMVLAILALVALFAFFFRMSEQEERLPFMAATATSFTYVGQVNGEVHVPRSSLVEGRAHFFLYRNGSKEVPFFVLYRPDDSYGAAIDACSACYRARLGFRQDGRRIICNNCDMAFRPEDIGVRNGGCNPVPLETALTESDLVLKAAELEKAGKYF